MGKMLFWYSLFDLESCLLHLIRLQNCQQRKIDLSLMKTRQGKSHVVTFTLKENLSEKNKNVQKKAYFSF